MTELNRQLQEYLAQSKNGAGSSTVVSVEDVPPVKQNWFSSWSNPFTRSATNGASAAGPSFSWPWTSEPDPCLPGMSRSQRLMAFGVCAALCVLCFGLAGLYAPFLLFKARKFALLWSLGSLFALFAAAILRGPSKLLMSPTPGAIFYLCTLAATLYAALSLHSTLLTALGAVLQVAAILGYVVALLPGGSGGMRFLGSLATSAIKRTVSGKTMPI